MARTIKTKTKTRTKTRTRTRTRMTKGRSRLFGGAAAALLSPKKRQTQAEAQAEAQAQALTSTSMSNIYRPANAKTLGVGTTKLVWGTQSDPGWAYMNTTPAKMVGYKKQDMINDYIFAAKLHRDAEDFFPAVVPAWNTPSKFIYKKELCEQIKNETIDAVTLERIIVAALALMEKHSLFTLDLKPDNLGILRKKINFIDFSPENSFKLKPGLPDEIKNIYVSLSILILLVYCCNYNQPLYVSGELFNLAQKYIGPTKIDKSDFEQFYEENAKVIDEIPGTNPQEYDFTGPGYHPSTDPNIDFDFNAPTKPEIIVEPYLFLNTYGKNSDLKQMIEYLLVPDPA